MDALPVVNLAVSSAAALAAIKIVFQAGEIVQHIKDLDRRVDALERLREAHTHSI